MCVRFIFALLWALAAFLGSHEAQARRLFVPEAFSTIQAALDAAADGDTVLVRDGHYRENLRFGGRAVVLASYFALDRDLAHVFATVIDGSAPAHPDMATVVTFRDGETRASVLEGFTITGGRGTVWTDEHGFGLFVEGGGILVARASPTIRFNRVVGNRAARVCAACVSAGGGGIRVGDGAPLIEYNVIVDNEGLYGGGVVSNFAAVTLRHNVIARNRVLASEQGRTFGGGGVFVFGQASVGGGLNVFAHNTIVDNRVASEREARNEMAGRGGAIVADATKLDLRGNILWGNAQTDGPALARLPGLTLTAAYNLVQELHARPVEGPGHIDADPLLTSEFGLRLGSPAIDAGDPAEADPAGPGGTAAPARGTTRADLGAFGGAGAAFLPVARTTTAVEPAPGVTSGALRLWPQPTHTVLHVGGLGAPGTVEVVDLLGRRVLDADAPAGSFTLDVSGLSTGIYLVRVSGSGFSTSRAISVM